MKDIGITYRGLVHQWNCDHMGHMNVRHYFGRANDGLAVMLLQLGLPPRVLAERGLVLRARDQHLRFSKELRPGAGFSLHAGAVSESPELLATIPCPAAREAILLSARVTRTLYRDMIAGAVAGAPSPSAAAA